MRPITRTQNRMRIGSRRLRRRTGSIRVSQCSRIGLPAPSRSTKPAASATGMTQTSQARARAFGSEPPCALRRLAERRRWLSRRSASGAAARKRPIATGAPRPRGRRLAVAKAKPARHVAAIARDRPSMFSVRASRATTIRRADGTRCRSRTRRLRIAAPRASKAAKIGAGRPTGRPSVRKNRPSAAPVRSRAAIP